MPGPTSHLYYSQRLRLHYVDWGNEGAPHMLMIHGGRDHCRNWDWVAERLQSRYHIVAPDLRAARHNDWATGGLRWANYVYDITQLILQKKMAPVTLLALAGR
jgi:pimeloyl-ACP methyl ester carboxylesterase